MVATMVARMMVLLLGCLPQGSAQPAPSGPGQSGYGGGGGVASANITIATWTEETKCEGLPDRVENVEPGTCIPLAPMMEPGLQKTWVRAQCQEVTGFFWDIEVEVVLRQYGDKDCTTTDGQGPPITTQPDTCFEVRENINHQFIEDITFSCEGVHNIPQDDGYDGSWGVSGTSLMVAAVLCMCLFGQCQAQSRVRRYRPRVGAAAQRRSLNQGMYDPSEHVGYGSVRESSAGSGAGSRRDGESGGDGDGGGRAVANELVIELSPAAKELVKEHEESGAEAPTMQQITQMVLRAKSVPPAEKRHTMMLLFRHWGYAGGEKPPASDHPTTTRQRQSERNVEAVEQSVDVEAPPATPAADLPAAVEAGSTEVDTQTPLLQGAE
jgi:hypothetical protein